MIPGIEDIVDGLLTAQYGRLQAIDWLNQHIALVRVNADLRDAAALAALQALATQFSYTTAGTDAWQYADAFVAAR